MTGKQRKIYERILLGRCDANLPLRRVRCLLVTLGFEERVESSHHVFTRPGLNRPIPLQDGGGGKCKPDQVRQLRKALRGQEPRATSSYRILGSAKAPA